MKTAGAVLLLLLGCASAFAADRYWQQGTWTQVKITRPKIVIGVKPKPEPGQAPAMTEIRSYVITTADLRLEVKEPSPPPRRPVAAIVGLPVTFAVENNIVYVRDDDGTEYKLQLTKREKPRRAER